MNHYGDIDWIDGIMILMILKKVTGTLVTLKRLASVQEQRIHPGAPIGITRIGVGLLFRGTLPFEYLRWVISVHVVSCNHSASPPGGNQVDGLPPALSGCDI